MSHRGRGRGQRGQQDGSSEQPPSIGGEQDGVDPLIVAENSNVVEHQSVSELMSSVPRPAGRGRRARPTTILSPVVTTEFPSSGPSRQESSAPDQFMNLPDEQQQIGENLFLHERPSTSAQAAAEIRGYRTVQIKTSGQAREPILDKKGTQGTPVNYGTNFVRVKIAENKGYFEYRVDFDPPIDSGRTRRSIFKNICQDEFRVLGNYDGRNLLYLPVRLPSQLTQVTTHLPTDPNAHVVVKVQFTKELELDDCVQFYNVLLTSINRILGYIEMGRNFYDPEATETPHPYKLDIWPGYSTRIESTEAGLMLCLDVKHRILRQETVLDMLNNFRASNPSNFKEMFADELIGSLVLTRYKSNCYKVDDVEWNYNPTTTFSRRGSQMTYIDYYKNQYQLSVTDMTQPLLISQPKRRRQEKLEETRLISLLPEFCHLSGLSNNMISNYNLMKAVAEFTRLNCTNRVSKLNDYLQKLKDDAKVQKLLGNWGILLEHTLIELQGRIIGGPNLEINPRHTIKAKADFSRDSALNPCYQPIALRNFVVICTKHDKPIADEMLRVYAQVCGPLGIIMGSPGTIFTLDRPNTNKWLSSLREAVSPKNVQLVIIILPMDNSVLFGDLKKYCAVDRPIPSQVIRPRTLKDPKKIKSVMQKVALQINCKLGGPIWSLSIPLKSKTMFVGMDVYHDPKRKNPSVTAIVSFLNTKCTEYFSQVIYQKPHQETGNSINSVVCLSFEEFRKVNGILPERIFVFRDGVSDGQLELVKETEVQQFHSAISHMYGEDRKPLFTFSVVQKRIPERFFAVKENGQYDNPQPGSVVDHTINRPYLFDFFLVSQLVRQGTVTPTHFVVLDDNSNIKPDVMQKIAFASTFMYFNWAGTIRVPAVCQYAHKLAYKAGVQMKETQPSPEMDRVLWYL